jgi:HK97 family phage major capsid protein
VGFYRSFSATEEENLMEKEEKIEVIEEVVEPSDEVSTEEQPSDETTEPVNDQPSDEANAIIAEKDAEIEKLQAEVEKLENLLQLDDCTKEEETESIEEEIRSVAKIMDAESMVDSALERKISVQEFINENKNFTIKKDEKKMNKFDICKAFRSLMGAENAEFERSVSADAYRNAGLAVNHNAIVLREFGADGNAAGIADATEYRGDSFIEALRKKMAVDARFISGITGNIQVPNQTGVSTVAWTNGSVAPTNPKVDMLTLSPRRLGAYVDVDRNLLCNGSLDAINLVVEDLLAQIARKLD